MLEMKPVLLKLVIVVHMSAWFTRNGVDMFHFVGVKIVAYLQSLELERKG